MSSVGIKRVVCICMMRFRFDNIDCSVSVNCSVCCVTTNNITSTQIVLRITICVVVIVCVGGCATV